MEKQKHTPEPWEVWPHGQNGQICIGHLESHSNLVREVCKVDGDDMANAARIVACVNACAGIENPEAIPALVAAMKTILADNRDYASRAIDARSAAYNALAALRGE